MSVKEQSFHLVFRDLLIMMYFPSYILLKLLLLIHAYALDSIFVIECPWSVLSLFSFRDLLDLDLDLDVSQLSKYLLRWDRGNYRIHVCLSFLQHRSTEIVSGPYFIILVI